jgi:predicted GNAT superfamily acetyltransferase
MAEIIIKPLRHFEDMQSAVDLQKIYWGEGADALVPAHMLFSLAAHGGHVLAAFDGSHMVGVLIGFLGTSEENETRPAMANLQVVSKRMVVLPEYRSHGVGYRLKLAQRDLAVKQGIRLVTWTFDPLLAPNAHLNVRKLGVICHDYLVNYYGTEDTPGLSALGTSDRLLAEWWVTNRRVEERISGSRNPLTLRHYLDAGTTLINPAHADLFIRPAEAVDTPRSSLALVEIPLNSAEIMQAAPELAQRWRMHIRDVFQRRFGAGDSITDFVRDQYEGRDRAFYVLSVGAGSGERYLLN